jgi:hypothetical protein
MVMEKANNWKHQNHTLNKPNNTPLKKSLPFLAKDHEGNHPRVKITFRK